MPAPPPPPHAPAARGPRLDTAASHGVSHTRRDLDDAARRPRYRLPVNEVRRKTMANMDPRRRKMLRNMEEMLKGKMREGSTSDGSKAAKVGASSVPTDVTGVARMSSGEQVQRESASSGADTVAEGVVESRRRSGDDSPNERTQCFEALCAGSKRKYVDKTTRPKRPKQARLVAQAATTSDTASGQHGTANDHVEGDAPAAAHLSVALHSASAARSVASLTSKQGLRSKTNPITHSDMATRTVHYVSSSTGHQVSNNLTAGGPSKASGYWDTRLKKLQNQAAEKCSSLFLGVVAYINGYTGERSTNQELRRQLQSHGAKVVVMPSASTTHVISAMPLSAKKTHELLGHAKASRAAKLVKPEWVLDSIEAKRRMQEWAYAFGSGVQPSIATMLVGFAPRRDPSGAAPTGDAGADAEKNGRRDVSSSSVKAALQLEAAAPPPGGGDSETGVPDRTFGTLPAWRLGRAE